MRTILTRTRPELTTETVPARVGEEHRSAVYLAGEMVGHVVYVRRRRPGGGSCYGWRVAGHAGRLMSKRDAVAALLR